ncbi:MAG: insulinase family protein [Myxococcales bacterium]|nr:insulinase family protein [Myxococcales bacterium]
MKTHIVRERLPNGLLAVAISRPWASTAMFCVDVRVGARFEAPQDSGLSHFLEHMIFQGCDGLPTPEAVNEASERLGAALDASTTRDSTRFEHWVAADRLTESARLVGALLGSPRFASIESERAIILEEALDEFDEDGRRVDAETLSRRALWPASPIGQSVIGELAHLRRFGVADLRRHHARFYGAANMVATAVGPQSVDELMAITRDALGRLPAGQRTEPAPPGALPEGPVIDLVDDHRSQCDCRLVLRTPGRADPDAAAFALLRIALDDGLASRMHRRLGGELGLAYDQWALWEHYPDTGAFELGAQVSPGKVRTFFTEAQRLIEGLISAPPEGEELARVRFRARWAIESALDTPDGLVSLHGAPYLYTDAPPGPADRIAAFDRITTDDLRRVARRLIEPRGYVACCVGPIDKATRRALRAGARKFGPTDAAA